MTPTQTGYQVHQWGGALAWEEVPVPVPGPGEVLVAVGACGVGLTVLNCINGDLSDDPALLPRVPGHELVGRVIETGPGTPRNLAGRLVAAYFYLSCGTCSECAAGRQSRCERLEGWMGVHRDGGYAPFAVLPALNAVVLPEGIDPVAATVVADAVATPVHICRQRARVGPGDRVVVIGAGGGVGGHMVQVARLYGGDVVGMDVTDDKLSLLEELGAAAVDSTDIGRIDPEALWSSGRPTVVVDLVGSESTLSWAAAGLAPGGRLIVLTTFRGRRLDVDPRELVFREVAVLGSRYAGIADVVEAGHLVASGRVRPVIGRTTDPAALPELHDVLARGGLRGRGALIWNEEV